jgi:hypothetical protein
MAGRRSNEQHRERADGGQEIGTDRGQECLHNRPGGLEELEHRPNTLQPRREHQAEFIAVIGFVPNDRVELGRHCLPLSFRRFHIYLAGADSPADEVVCRRQDGPRREGPANYCTTNCTIGSAIGGSLKSLGESSR